jgi:MFS-type transporter involved in bile tolerance (Atg22 family)
LIKHITNFSPTNSKHALPLLWNIYLYQKCLFILHYISAQTIYIYKKINERICEIESRFKIVYFQISMFIYKQAVG